MSKSPYSDDGICRKSVAQIVFPSSLSVAYSSFFEKKECDAHAQTSIQIYE